MNFDELNINDRLKKQLRFINEIDRVKQIFRKSRLFDNSRFENDAEHSWTICIMSCLLGEYADFHIDAGKVFLMLLIHDIVEIDAGDTFLYSQNRADAYNNEAAAAERIFGILDTDQKNFFLDIWNEFEEGQTCEARFAKVFDRLEPLLQNYITEGFTWKKFGITYDMIIEKNIQIRDASEKIWDFVLVMLDDAVTRGFLKR